MALGLKILLRAHAVLCLSVATFLGQEACWRRSGSPVRSVPSGIGKASAAPARASDVAPIPSPQAVTSAHPLNAPQDTTPDENPANRAVSSAQPDPQRSPQVPPIFPSHTTVQEPYLGRELDLSSPFDPFFSSTPELRHEHRHAHRRVQSVAVELRARRWRLEVRTGCPFEHDGDLGVEGRAIVRDGTGKIRAFAEQSGTGDSAAVWKLYYDGASQLRVAVFRWANYMGHSAAGIMRFDSGGQFEACTSVSDRSPPWPCDHEDSVETEVDSDVAAALRPEVHTQPPDSASAKWPIAWATALDPMKEFSKCETPYRPRR